MYETRREKDTSMCELQNQAHFQVVKAEIKYRKWHI